MAEEPDLRGGRSGGAPRLRPHSRAPRPQGPTARAALGQLSASIMWVSCVGRTAMRCAPVARINTSRAYQTISTPNAPSAIGPYSQAVVYNGTAYVSGCIPFDPQTMQCVDGGIEAQAERAIQNLLNVVTAAGSDKSHILKTTVFMKDMNDFAKVNVRTYTAYPGHL